MDHMHHMHGMDHMEQAARSTMAPTTMAPTTMDHHVHGMDHMDHMNHMNHMNHNMQQADITTMVASTVVQASSALLTEAINATAKVASSMLNPSTPSDVVRDLGGSTDVDHSHHGHGHGDGGSNMAMMPMVFFENAYNFKVLFEAWTVEKPWQFAVTIIGCFIMGFVYEGLRIFRQVHFQRRGDFRKLKGSGSTGTSNTNISAESGCCQITNELGENDKRKECVAGRPVSHKKIGVFSSLHIVQTILHLVLVTLSFLLMLAVMSFNVWVLVAVVCGVTIAYFAFGHYLTIPMDGDSCCT